MPALTLHHYPQSPFAEKARLMLGLKGLAWQSVIIPRIMPKPDLVALTGGYRRTPVLQVGADVYCDTALIARRLERETTSPALFPAGLEAAAAMLAQFADQTLFQLSVALNFAPDALAARFAGVPDEHRRAFAADRSALFANGNFRPMAPEHARPQWLCQLDRLDRQLQRTPFLLGAEPCVADLAVYHPIWFVAGNPSLASALIEPFAAVQAWLQRIAALGHGHAMTIDAAQAIVEAAAHAPEALPRSAQLSIDDIELGDPVSIAATDYGADPVSGTLVWQDAGSVVIARDDPRAGRVHVHFPRIGYALQRA